MLLLVRMPVNQGRYDSEETRKAYIFCLDSASFDCGMPVSSGPRGRRNPESQANGAGIRISPLGIFGITCHLGKEMGTGKLFVAQGRAGPSDSNDPHASELLAQIQAEREKQATVKS